MTSERLTAKTDSAYEYHERAPKDYHPSFYLHTERIANCRRGALSGTKTRQTNAGTALAKETPSLHQGPPTPRSQSLRLLHTTHLEATESSVDRCFQVVLAPPERCGHQHLRELVLALVRFYELHQVFDRVVHLFNKITLLGCSRFATLDSNNSRQEPKGKKRRNDSNQPDNCCAQSAEFSLPHGGQDQAC